MFPQLVKGEREAKDKITHEDCGFQNPSREEDEHCSLCGYYIPAHVPRCQIVKSPIQANDYCNRFKEKK